MNIIRLCGQDVEVVASKDASLFNRDGMGRSLTKSGKLVIADDMPKTVKDSTLMHELLHYILGTNDVDRLIKDGMEEIVVSVLANSLLAWMRDNPRMVNSLMYNQDPDECGELTRYEREKS
jgi:Zn-dependent peptidase ImmA (M78 family)